MIIHSHHIHDEDDDVDGARVRLVFGEIESDDEACPNANTARSMGICREESGCLCVRRILPGRARARNARRINAERNSRDFSGHGNNEPVREEQQRH